ncbi:MAG: hypothetical protein WA919_10190 [Coleofasciculaceae cyanobacterium]
MTTYSMQLVGDTLKVDFAKTDGDKPIPADGDRIVQDVQFLVRQMIASGQLTGGNLLKIQGRISVLASYTLSHEVAHLYRAIAVSDTRLGAYVVVSSTAAEYPFSSRIDFETGEVREVKSPTQLAAPSIFINWEGDVLRAQINNAVQVDGDQIVRDAKAQLQQLINSGQLSGGKLLKINGRSTVLASFVIALELSHYYSAIAVFDPKTGDRGLDRYIVTISQKKAEDRRQRAEGFLNGSELDSDQTPFRSVRAASPTGEKRGLCPQEEKGRRSVPSAYAANAPCSANCPLPRAFQGRSLGHTPNYQVGDTIDVERDHYQTVKVVLCGCPNTGKTIFRDGLKEAIFKRADAPEDFYTVSGCPDGDGCWFSETAQNYPELAKQLKAEYKAKFTPEFAAAKARDIKVNKNSLLLYDVGGKISPENELIMSQATHAVILAKSELEVAQWQAFCQKLNLPVIAVIYSDIEATADEIQTELPQLTGTVHQLKRGEAVGNRLLIKALAKRLVELAKLGRE